jgi:hypothetical protein
LDYKFELAMGKILGRAKKMEGMTSEQMNVHAKH